MRWQKTAAVGMLFGIFLSVSQLVLKDSRKMIRVGLSGTWNTLHPGLQHTLDGDLVLSNQFEALVGVNASGSSIPLAASKWEISSDFRVFKFEIDRSRTFPDGSRLTANDFKVSWESAGQLNPISSNNSLLDVLYKIQGFQEFKSTGHLSGVKVVDENRLEIEFASPFRMALEHLQGNRFAAFREVDGKFQGTGVFEIETVGANHVLMLPKPDQPKSIPSLDVRHVPSPEILNSLLSGSIDAIHYLEGNRPDIESLKRSDIELIVGPESLHLALGLNSTKSSIFAKRDNRRAMLFLVARALRNERSLLPPEPFFQTDLQFYLPFQAGRLSDGEVLDTIARGQHLVSAFIEETKRRPVVVKGGITNAKVIEFLRTTGISIAADSSALPPADYLKLLYADNGPDMLIENFSIANGDPDGIYHVLGRFGAIRSKYIFDDAVGDALEHGRMLLASQELDAGYRVVSERLLTEIPMIHLGFARALTALRRDRVYADMSLIPRNFGQLHFLRATQ